ncbi:MAG: metallophosphoesterase family protein [Kiloniellaceae bacterium]
MTDFRIVQVSDIHLSRKRAYFLDNWDVFVEQMRADPPDRIYVTGDLCVNGPNEPDDIVFAREQLDRLPVPWKALPGTHDSGELPPDTRLGKPLTAERREFWLEHFGPDYWFEDVGDWCFVGLNAQLIGSGLDEERAQWLFLESVAEGRADPRRSGRALGLFLHKPLYLRRPDETDQQLSALPPEGRARLLAFCAQHKVRFVASGHLHCYRSMRHGGLRLIWAPGTSFISSVKAMPAPKALRRAGYVEYRFTGKRFTARLVEPPLFVSHDFRNWFLDQGSTVHLPPRPLRAGEGGWGEGGT